MNYPVDSNLHSKYDIILDGGSLEHIFNFPCAIKNCMNLVKKGGSIFIFTMCNNHSGHGFYQFSPELFFRIFDKKNGFKIQDVIVEKHHYPGLELSLSTECYSVTDPAFLKKRVGLVSKYPIVMLIHAIKTEDKEVFEEFPIQSDYLEIYNSFASRLVTQDKKQFKEKAKYILSKMPIFVKNYIIGNFQLYRYSFSNKHSYKRWYPFE